MLTLELLPRLNKIKLDWINYYLALIINELLEFWNSFSLLISDKYLTGKHIRLAVICYSNNISAIRKLCNHISALVRCYRCYKRVNNNEG